MNIEATGGVGPPSLLPSLCAQAEVLPLNYVAG